MKHKILTKKNIILKTVLFLFFYVSGNKYYALSAVTYDFSWGRFGDHLASYCHAKWIAYKFDIPLLYKPFIYSDKLALHVLEKHAYSHDVARKFKAVVQIDPTKEIVIDKNADILYVVMYFAESFFDYVKDLKTSKMYHPFPIDWHDVIFLSEIRRNVRPLLPLPEFNIPQGVVSVAVHVRRGTGYDVTDFLNDICAHKSPPDSYYIEQLQKIAEIYKNKMVYVYLFTDHDKPLEIVNYYRQAVDKSNLIFDCRENGNAHNCNVLTDFFGLTKFDCLIRSDSHFSLMASKLTDYKIQISPKHITRNGKLIVVDEVNVESNI